jgi:hypothetical protein
MHLALYAIRCTLNAIDKGQIQIKIRIVKKKIFLSWNGKGTSYPFDKDKVYDGGTVSDIKKGISGQGLTPAAKVP